MDCVILAAGKGDRLRKDGISLPKPLISVMDKPLLKYVLDELEFIDTDRVIVVLGFKSEAIRRFLSKLDYPFQVIPIVNPDYERENGSSLLTCKEVFKKEDQFVLMMADHVADPTIYQKACKHKGLGLCIDSKAPKHFTPSQIEEATKVKVKDGRVIKIGKDLSSWDGIDTGVFSLTPMIFEALNHLDSKHQELTLTAAVSTLIEWDIYFQAIDVSGLFWMDIDTVKDLTMAEQYLLSDNEGDNYKPQL